jgi:hypothetical protein
MRNFLLILLVVFLVSCNTQKNFPVVTLTLDNIQGTWNWVSTCNDSTDICTYASQAITKELIFSTHYQSISVNPDTTITITADYQVLRKNSLSGILILFHIVPNYNQGDTVKSDISLVNNQLLVKSKGLTSAYNKIH